MCVCLGLVLLQSRSAEATTEPTSSSQAPFFLPGPSAYTVPVRVTSENGCPAVQPTVTRSASGAVWYTYSGPDGAVGQQVVPPPDFNPATASAAELKHYLYPLPDVQAVAAAEKDPTQSNLAAAMQARVRLAKDKVRDIGADHCLAPRSSYLGTDQSANWGGEVSPAQGQSGYVPYSFVVGYFVEPGFLSQCPEGPAAESSWTGLGGDGDGAYPLLQSGSLVETPADPPYLANNVPRAFLEGIPTNFVPALNNQIYMLGPDVISGDVIASGNEWDYTPGASTGTWYTGVVDETNPSALNWYMSWTLARDLYGPGVSAPGATEEAIDERPTNPQTQQPYSLDEPTLDVFEWLGVYAEEYPAGSGPFDIYPDSLNYLALNMYDSLNQTSYLTSGAAQPFNFQDNAYSGYGFFDYWNTCGPEGF